MEQWFDLHLYLANWGTRRLMMRLPKHLLNRADIDPFLHEVDWVEIWTSDDNLIIDIRRDEMEADDDWDDGSNLLAALASLRAGVLSGDFRLFYLLWLTAVQEGLIADDEVEPLPGIGPSTGALESFAEFFGIDLDLVQAAAERGANVAATSKTICARRWRSSRNARRLSCCCVSWKAILMWSAEIRNRLRQKHPTSAAHRTVGSLRTRAQEIAEARERAVAEQRDAEWRRQAEEAEKALRTRLKALKQQGASVWREIEEEIERRNASSYEPSGKSALRSTGSSRRGWKPS